MTFNDVIGQEAAKEGLMSMWRNNVLPHALLLTGPEGVGGLPMALALAQFLFCENKGETDSCGKCAGCSKAARLEHADLHLSFPSIPKPQEKAMSRLFVQDFRAFVSQTPYGTTYDWLQYINAENKQGNITAQECREIIDVLNLKSYEGGKKVLVMWRPEYLGKEGNILLKMIEEPPNDTVLIFVAEGTEDILQTIRSRTQEVKLAPIKAADIAEALVAHGQLEPIRAAQVAHMAMGSYTEALKLVRHTENDLFPEVRNLFNNLFTNNGIGIVKFTEEMAKNGREQQKNFLTYVITLLEHAIRVRYRPDGSIALPPQEAQFVEKFAKMNMPYESFGKMAEIVSDTIMYIERNAHPKTQLLAMTVKMQYIIKGKPLPNH